MSGDAAAGRGRGRDDQYGAYSIVAEELSRFGMGEIRQIILSAPRAKNSVEAENGRGKKNIADKANLRPVRLKNRNAWQLTKILGDQAFHENFPEGEFAPRLAAFLAESRFCEINALAITKTIHYRITKKGKLLKDEHAIPGGAGSGAGGSAGSSAGGGASDGDGALAHAHEHANMADLSHDRRKRYILAEGMPIAPFVDLGIFDKDFRIIQSKYDKFRQINRFVEIIADAFKNNRAADATGDTDGAHAHGSGSALSIADFGCGKSYLTFFIYYYFTQILKINVDITGYDIKSDIVARCNGIANKYGYENLRFVAGDIANIADMLPGQPGAREGRPQRPDTLITLHACDTATDYALYYAIKNKVKYIFSVPCCQHEVNAQIRSDGSLSPLLRHGLYKERLAALLTDGIRCEILRDMGYDVDVVEFVGMDNTPQNAMIRATLKNSAAVASPAIAGIHAHTNIEPAASVRALLSEYKIDQTLATLVYNLCKDS